MLDFGAYEYRMWNIHVSSYCSIEKTKRQPFFFHFLSIIYFMFDDLIFLHGCLSMSIHMYHMSDAHGGQKRAVNPLELEFWNIVSLHMGFGN